MAIIGKVILTSEESYKLEQKVGCYSFTGINRDGLHLLQGFYMRDDVIVGSSNQHPMPPSIFNGSTADKVLEMCNKNELNKTCVDCGDDYEKFISLYEIELKKYNNR